MAGDKLEIRPAPGGGALLRVRARPGASRNKLEGLHGGALKVAVTAPPEKGKANKALLATLAKALGLPKNGLTLAKGETSRDKWVSVAGMSPAELEKSILEVLAE